MMNRPPEKTPQKRRRRPSTAVAAAIALFALLTVIAPASGGSPNAPSSPTTLAVAATAATSVTITWTASTVANGNKQIVAYDLYNDLVKVDTLTQLTTLKYTFVGLKCGTSYKLGVAGRESTGHSSTVAYLVAATSPCVDTLPPSAPGGVSQIAKTATSATVTWSPSADNVGVVGYGTYQGGVRIAQTALTSYTFSSLSCGTSTTIGLDAYDAAGNRSGQTSFVVSTGPCSDTQPPSTPSGLSQTGNTATSISLKWNPSSDNVGISYYGIRSNGTQVGTTTLTSYTVTGLACATSYTITVAAYDAAGNHSISSSVTFATAACPPSGGGSDTTPPSVPTNLKVASTTQTSVSLSWSASTDNVGVVGYGAYSAATRVGQTAQTTYTFSGLGCGKSYTLAIDAYDAAGNRSNIAYATAIASTSPCSDSQPPTQPTNVTLLNRTGTSISLTWTASSDNIGVVGYGVYNAASLSGTSSATSYTVTGLSCGSSYTIGVDAYDGSGNRSTKATVMLATAACGDVQPPTTPTSLLPSGVTQTAATLSWTASTDNVGVAGYDVFANGTKVGTTTTTTYAISGLTCGATNSLGVEAFDASGNRSTRALVNATTTACATSSANLYVSPSGNDANACLQATPCASFNRAYQLALPGQVIQVAGGTYPAQVISSRAALRNLSPGCATGSTSNCVIIRPAAGQTVTINGKLEIHGSSLYVQGTPSSSFSGVPTRGRSYTMKVTGYVDTEADSSSVYPDHVIVEGTDSTSFGIFNVDTATFKNMDVGPATVSSGCGVLQGNGFENKIGMAGAGTNVPTNVTVDSLMIHNQNRDSAGAVSDCHFGGLFLVNANGLTIRNTVFSQNAVYNLQIQNFSGPAPTNVTLENNWFGCPVQWLYQSETACDNQADVQFAAASAFVNFTIRNNSFDGGIGEYTPGATFSNIVIDSNAGAGSLDCYPGMTFRYNVWANGANCSSSDKRVGSMPFVSTAVGSEDLHLQSGSPAIDAGDPSGPSKDIDGQGRPMGNAPDAGSDEKS